MRTTQSCLLLSGLYRRPWNCTMSCARTRSWVFTTDRELGNGFPHPAPKAILFTFFEVYLGQAGLSIVLDIVLAQSGNVPFNQNRDVPYWNRYNGPRKGPEKWTY